MASGSLTVKSDCEQSPEKGEIITLKDRPNTEKEINERRRHFTNIYFLTGSKKKALKETSKLFDASIDALRIDWNRRSSWPREVFDGLASPILTFLYILEIRNTLRQNDSLIRGAKSPSNKIAAIRTKIDTIFRLEKLQRSVSLERVLERLEKLEARLDALQEPKKSSSEEGEE